MGTDDEVLQYIIEYKAGHDGNSPSIREIKEAMGMSSSSVVVYYLNKLIRQERITRIAGSARSICVKGGRWQLQS
jgi:SOS-response transcriptional repressor LexA